MIISDEQVSILCDVSQTAALQLDPGKQRDLDQLIANGYIELSAHESSELSKYKLTGKGERVLTDRGAGLNES